MSGGLDLAHPSAVVTPPRSFAKLVEAEFPTLLSHGFRVVVLRDFGLNGVAVTLAGDRRWLRLTWETREASVFVSWGELIGPGRFNDDPYRNPRSMGELAPDISVREVGVAGTFREDDAKAPAELCTVSRAPSERWV